MADFYYAVGPYVRHQEGGITFTVPPAGATGIDLRSIPGHADLTYGLFWSKAPLGKDYRSFGRGDIRDITTWDRSVFASMFGLRTIEGNSLADALWALLMVEADPIGDARPLPIMPSRRKHLDLVLSGHGVVARKTFDPMLAEAPPVRDLLQRQYRKHREDALAGKLKDEVHHLRVLDAWVEKYGLTEDYFRPADLPVEQRVKHETTHTETFTKADGALGGDNTWNDFHGTSVYTVVSNEAAKGSAFGASRLDSALSSDDHYSKAAIADIAGGDRSIGCGARMTGDATVSYYLAVADGPSNGETWKWVAGSLSGIGTQGGTFASGDVIEIECDGSTIARKKNGSTQDSTTDTSLTGNLYAGLASVHGSSGGELDDFEAADLSAGGADALLAENIASSTSVGAPSIGQAHALSASDVASASSVTQPAIGQVHALSADDISASPSVGTPTLAENTGDNLLAEDITAQPSVGAPSLGQVHALTASDIAATPSTGTPSLGIVGDQANDGGQYPISDPRHPYWRNRIEVEEAEADPEADPGEGQPAAPQSAAKQRRAPYRPAERPRAIANALADVPVPEFEAPKPVETTDNFAQREMRRIEEMLLLELID